MPKSKLNEWFQTIASLSVFVGLVLVAIEIRESNRVAVSQSIAELSKTSVEMQMSELGSDFFEIYVKSFVSPEDLTEAEMLKLNTWLSAQVDYYNWWLNMYQLGTARYTPTEMVLDQIDYFFGSKFGRAWFTEHKNWFYPEIADAVEENLVGRPILTYPPQIEGLRSHF